MHFSIELAVWIFLLLPLPLLAMAWKNAKMLDIMLIILTLSAILLWTSGAVRSVKLTMLGPDHSQRLLITIALNLLLVGAVGIFLIIKRMWTAVIAASLVLSWMFMLAINSMYLA
jgi:hypothetical protein